MNFIKRLIQNYKEKKEKINNDCNNLISEINELINYINDIFQNNNNFVDPNLEKNWQSKYNLISDKITREKVIKLKKANNYKLLLKNIETLNNINLTEKIRIHNDNIANIKINDAYNLIGNVEGKKLDKQQMKCIIKDTHNNLVIAGAGTGKTTTIVGKVKYLLKTLECNPEDILVLSFTNASASEMKERIAKETGADITACTFHKLGLSIITKVNRSIPKISQLNLSKFIKEQLQQNIKNKDYLNLLNNYFLYNYVVPKSEFEFKNEKEYKEYLQYNPPTTIKNEIVKSYGEMDIANYLNQNNINYIYEEPYKYDVADAEYGQYRPDFYLPDYNIYIEYFSIDRNGEVPPYFKPSHNMSATQSYQESMRWKRKIHKENNTVMIECYAFEKSEGILLKKLEQRLLENSVKFNPKSPEELWANLSTNNKSLVDGIIELFQTIINLIKSNNYTFEDLRNITEYKTDNILLNLVEPIYNAYCDYLNNNKEIDFNDMINLATNYVNTGKFINPYKYVIIDEYQDISKSRFKLIDSLRQSNDFKLFCVGDDWQSIYRFSGSDIGYILDFEKYWGPSEISKIETTYRFSQSLIDISSNFIMKNPKQIYKQIKSQNFDYTFALEEIQGYTEEYSIRFMIGKLKDLPKNSTVFLIGRYNFEINLLKNFIELNYNFNNETGLVDVKYFKRPDLKIQYVTAHKSKGLQADYVFIINNKKGRMGFPSQIQDAHILKLLLESSDNFPLAEERRLFYVAITRAKRKVFLVTIKNKESEFVQELNNIYGREMKKSKYTCPKCGGRLIRKHGQYGDFLGCSNYSKTGCNYTKKINNSN